MGKSEEELWKCLNPKCGKMFKPYIVDEQYEAPNWSRICKKCRKELEKEERRMKRGMKHEG